MRGEVLQRERDVKERLHEREVFAEPADRATAEEEHWLDLRLRELESLLLKKIDEALRRIEGKEYVYCEKTGDPIGIPRLLARPTATVCVDVKGQDEQLDAVAELVGLGDVQRRHVDRKCPRLNFRPYCASRLPHSS